MSVCTACSSFLVLSFFFHVKCAVDWCMLLSIVVHVHWCMPRPRVMRDPAEEGKVLQAAARDVARPARDRQAQQQQRAQHIACDERCPF